MQAVTEIEQALKILIKVSSEFDRPHAPWQIGAKNRDAAIKTVVRALVEKQLVIREQT